MKNERKTAEFGTGEDAERLHDFLQDMGYLPRVHIAPCSCELHVRIRELEAELSECRLWHSAERTAELKARAEKMEKERDDWKECAESMQQERDSVKARVAELSQHARGLHGQARGRVDSWPLCNICNGYERYPGPMPIEAREREAD